LFLLIEEDLNDEWQGRLTIRVFRFGQWLVRKRGVLWLLPQKMWWVVYRIWVQTLLGANLSPHLSIGVGVRFAHAGRSVVFHHRAVVGERATIYHGVTVGMRGGMEVPVIGDDVVLGTGCAVVGAVTVGNGAAIGPNAVVVQDVQPGCHVVAASPTLLPRPLTLSDDRRSNSGRTLPRIDSRYDSHVDGGAGG